MTKLACFLASKFCRIHLIFLLYFKSSEHLEIMSTVASDKKSKRHCIGT
jgi:hypothetical protein